MANPPYVFNQLNQLLPKDMFEWLVKKHNGNAYVKGYSCWNHLLVMILAQLTSRRSLRDIETTLKAHSDKIYRMGIGKTISRNNIAHANAKRDVDIFRELAQEMMRRASGISMKDNVLKSIGAAFPISGFLAIDSTTISLDLRRYAWSVPQDRHGGVKVHTMYDLLRKVPRMCLITGHFTDGSATSVAKGYYVKVLSFIEIKVAIEVGLHTSVARWIYGSEDSSTRPCPLSERGGYLCLYL